MSVPARFAVGKTKSGHNLPCPCQAVQALVRIERLVTTSSCCSLDDALLLATVDGWLLPSLCNSTRPSWLLASNKGLDVVTNLVAC